MRRQTKPQKAKKQKTIECAQQRHSWRVEEKRNDEEKRVTGLCATQWELFVVSCGAHHHHHPTHTHTPSPTQATHTSAAIETHGKVKKDTSSFLSLSFPPLF